MLLEFDGTFLFALISFIIFVILMNLILYRPIVKIMDERQKFFDKNKDTALQSKQKAADIIQNTENEILSAKLEASNILSETQNVIKAERNSAIKKKKDEIKEKILSHGAFLQSQKDEAGSALKNEVNDFVKMTVSKVLETDINELQCDINIEQDRISKAFGGSKNA